MPITEQVFNQVLVMMILVAIGFICNKVKILPAETERPISNLLLMVVLPALIINSYQRDYDPKLVKGLLIAFGLAVVSHFIGIAVSYIFIRKKNKTVSIERFSVVYSNCGFMAIPLIQAVLGSDGVFYSVAYITIFNLLNWTHGACIISESRKITSILKVIFTPTIISIVVAMVLYFMQIRLPSVVTTTIEYVASINTPLAMLVTGISISKAGIFKTLTTPRAYYIAFLRLILVPLFTIILFKFITVDQNIILTNIIATSCSSAVAVILFANRYKKDSSYAAQLVAISTILSLVTIPLAVWFTNFIN